ncbi:MAG: lipoyl synthase [Actinomycetota bacterium]|nr:lipoyl synthase [Actinomycetota bacterium]
MSEIQGPARNLPIIPTVDRKPPWLRVKLASGPNFTDLKRIARTGNLHTVCEEARCPNIGECWEEREATFLIGGDRCTRRCAFCDVTTAPPLGYDIDEPRRVADAVEQMGLRYAVITGVARDDLTDGGAWLYAEVTRQIRARVPGCAVELLTPDFRGAEDPLRAVSAEAPDVLAHNIETVPRLIRRIRPAFTYERSLEFLRRARAWLPDTSYTKSNIIAGMGETYHEVVDTMRDLRDAGCDLLTIGQYLRPSDLQIPVTRFVHPDEFSAWKDAGEAMGFAWVESGPLVRSSYHAGKQRRAAVARSSAQTHPAPVARVAQD